MLLRRYSIKDMGFADGAAVGYVDGGNVLGAVVSTGHTRCTRFWVENESMGTHSVGNELLSLEDA